MFRTVWAPEKTGQVRGGRRIPGGAVGAQAAAARLLELRKHGERHVVPDRMARQDHRQVVRGEDAVPQVRFFVARLLCERERAHDLSAVLCARGRVVCRRVSNGDGREGEGGEAKRGHSPDVRPASKASRDAAHKRTVVPCTHARAIVSSIVG